MTTTESFTPSFAAAVMQSLKFQALCACGCGQPVKEGKKFLWGHHKGNSKGGMSLISLYRREYGAFNNAMRRCTGRSNDKDTENYMKRGIKFLFTSFEQFMAEVGPRPSPRHTLERINNDGDYEPGNLRWATMKEQQNNRRARKVVLRG